MTHFNNWTAAGKPKDGPLFTAKIHAHKKYKNAVYAAKNKSKTQVTDKLQENLLSANSRKFWRCWKGCFKSPSDKYDMNVNGLKDDDSIASHLAKHFQDTCTPENINTQNKFYSKLFVKEI